MKAYNNLVEALEDLYERGYIHDYNIKENTIICNALKQECAIQEFTIIEMYRFEDMSDPGSESILYALETEDGNKGTILDAYGIYSEALSPEMIEKLRYKKY
ncbi:phosphoribosylpyrophosphate synthetase [Aquimarina rhabdastrellae]